jgi:hypothetical protein
MVPVGLEDDDATIVDDDLPLDEPHVDEGGLRQSGGE